MEKVSAKNKKKVLVALSGGVDSSVAALMLKNQGYEVMAVTLKTFCYQGETGPKACCGLEGVAAAKAVSAKLGIPHIVLDVEETFQKEVIEDFVNEYAAGRTPNPCVRCNATVKIPYLLQKAKSYGCEFLATGHYARIVHDENAPFLIARGADKTKDQSYFLWEIPPEILKDLLLPCGGYSKGQIRQFARENTLSNAQKPESQEICFVPDGDYMNFLRNHLPDNHPGFKPGKIIGPDGRLLAQHSGYMNFTVGQRKGIGGGHGQRLYVCGIDAENRKVYVGTRESLMGRKLVVDKINCFVEMPSAGEELMIQVRYRSKAVSGKLLSVDSRVWNVELEEPVYAISPGQSAVFYQNDCLIAGGTICKAF
jgi:tRNA-specific 2-thiouridylase